MTWFKVDDSFYDHPKTFDAPDCAVALWVRAGTWSARNLTDGFVPTGLPARLCDDHDTAVRELVRRGLWKRTSGGYQYHDWKDYQPSGDQVAALRSKRAEAGRLGGLARAAKQNGSNGLASASPVAKQNPAPTRPDPTRSGGEGSTLTHDRAREGPRPEERCQEHQDDPDPPACRRCKTAREKAEAWDAAFAVAYAQAEAHARDTQPKCPRHPSRPARNCRDCRSEELGGVDD